MKTDDLIAVLAADTVRPRTVGERLVRSLPAAAAVSLIGLLVFWGTRVDLVHALGSAAVLKTVAPLVLVILAGALVIALAHPGMRSGPRLGVLGVFSALAAAVFVTTLAQGGLSGLTAALITPSLAVCLLSIPALALPFLYATLWALSSGAALRPRLTGAVAGIAAGGASAAVYSLYCDQDAALFVLPAYSAAIVLVALIGAVVGARVLAW